MTRSGCCGRMKTIRVYSTNSRAYGTSLKPQAAVLSDFPKLADAPPVLVTEALVRRWSRVPKILQLFPIMAEVRVLDRKLAANECNSCQKPPEIDKSAIDRAKIALAECSDDIALLVKRAANVLKYKVVYRKLSEPLKEIIR